MRLIVVDDVHKYKQKTETDTHLFFLFSKSSNLAFHCSADSVIRCLVSSLTITLLVVLWGTSFSVSVSVSFEFEVEVLTLVNVAREVDVWFGVVVPYLVYVVVVDVAVGNESFWRKQQQTTTTTTTTTTITKVSTVINQSIN